MSFWDNVKKFAQPYADDEYDDFDDEDELNEYEEEETSEPAPRRRASIFGTEESAPATVAAPAVSETSSPFSGHVVNMSSGSKQEVVLFHAKTFGDATKAADELRAKKAIILNMENVDKALTRRVVDFLSGCVYALDGKVKKIAQSTYLFCPHSMSIVGDLESFQGEVENYI